MVELEGLPSRRLKIVEEGAPAANKIAHHGGKVFFCFFKSGKVKSCVYKTVYLGVGNHAENEGLDFFFSVGFAVVVCD